MIGGFAMKAEIAAPAIVLGIVAVGWLGFTGLAVRRAALPHDAAGMMLAAFPLSHNDDAIFAAVAAAGGAPVRRTWFPGAWVVTAEEPGFAGRLKEAGAWAAFGSAPVGLPTLGGCAVVSVDTDRFRKTRLNP